MKMALSQADRRLVLALWKKMGSNVGIYATEALERYVLGLTFQWTAGQRRALRTSGSGCAQPSFFPQDLRGFPLHQNLLPTLGPEARL